MPFLQTVAALPPRSKAILAVSAVAILAIAFVILRVAAAPSYTLLSSGLDPAQTGKVTAALDEQGIAYELRSNGTALAVEKAHVARARVALAGQGVSVDAGAAGKGFELFDEQKLGASEFQMQVTYQRALEGEIARTLSSVQGVSGPQVQLVLPKDDLFADEATPATAAVMLSNTADTLEPGAVRGMAQIVAASVEGLKTENVTITDGSGQLLWPADDGSGGGGVTAGKQALEARYARAMEADLNALLVRTLGAGKAQVSVTADLNANKTSREELSYEKKGVPLKTQTETEKLRGGGARAGGAAGTGANIPAYSQAGAGGGGDSNYQRETESTEFGVGKRVERTEAKVEEPKAGPVPTSLLGPLRWIGIGLGALLFLFFMGRHLRKREGETLATPAWLTEIDEPVALSELEQRTQAMPEQPTIQLPPHAPDAGMQALGQLMEREPERVAAQVKQWIAED